MFDGSRCALIVVVIFLLYVIWGGRWQNGASATTEEEVEQINSHFSRLRTSSKHMLPEGMFEFLLTDIH